MQLLRTLLIIVIIYYMAKLFARYLLPYIVRYFIKRTVNKFNGTQQPKQKKPGEIHVEPKPGNKHVSDKMGEYVDYEEIDE